jgi:hypothetical protein
MLAKFLLASSSNSSGLNDSNSSIKLSTLKSLTHSRFVPTKINSFIKVSHKGSLSPLFANDETKEWGLLLATRIVTLPSTNQRDILVLSVANNTNLQGYGFGLTARASRVGGIDIFPEVFFNIAHESQIHKPSKQKGLTSNYQNWYRFKNLPQMGFGWHYFLIKVSRNVESKSVNTVLSLFTIPLHDTRNFNLKWNFLGAYKIPYNKDITNFSHNILVGAPNTSRFSGAFSLVAVVESNEALNKKAISALQELSKSSLNLKNNKQVVTRNLSDTYIKNGFFKFLTLDGKKDLSRYNIQVTPFKVKYVKGRSRKASM